jgi:hypothetical protein
VHSGTASGYFSAFLFIPAYRDGAAPFGDWVGSAVIAAPAWITGKGKVPNVADYALLEIADEPFQGQTARVGEVVGTLPAGLKATSPNHVHMAGYPSNLDGGEMLHLVASSSSKKAKNTTIIYGSDMAQGASGGPWIMNLGEPAAGQPSGPRNLIVGVASYLASGLVNGSSVLNTPLAQMFNTICANQAGNC